MRMTHYYWSVPTVTIACRLRIHIRKRLKEMYLLLLSPEISFVFFLDKTNPV